VGMIKPQKKNGDYDVPEEVHLETIDARFLPAEWRCIIR